MKKLSALSWSAFALLLLASALWLRWPALTDTVLDSDEGIYAFVASQWRLGLEPYRDLFDHKPPLVHLAYRLAFVSLGESMVSPRLLWTLLVAVCGLGCAAVAWRLRGGWTAAGIAGVAAVTFLGSPLVAGQTANTETLMVAAIAWSAFFTCGAALPPRLSPGAAALAGLCAGIALMAKPVALVEVLFLASWIALFSARRGRDLALFGAGAAVPGLAWIAYAAAQGSLGPMVEDVVEYNLHYASAAAAPVPARLVLLVVDHGPPLFLLWAGLAACFLSALRRERRAADFAIAWAAAALIGALSAGRLYEHYFQEIVPPMAVALGVSAAAVSSLAKGPLPRAVVLFVVALGLGPPLGARLRLEAEPMGCRPWQDRLAALVRQGTADDDRLVVWGYEPYVHFASRRRPPGPYFYKYPLLGESLAAGTARERLRLAATERAPAVVVVLKGELTAEPSGTPQSEILAAEAPFHWLLDGDASLETPHFWLYASAERRAWPWREKWLELFRRECAAAASRR